MPEDRALHAVLRDPATWICLLLGALLLLLDLGDSALSADEAQTGVIARTILHRGLPFAADGANMMGTPHHPAFDDRGLWCCYPWLPYYLSAASMALLGVSAFAARLPFALLGLACLPLSAWATRRVGGGPRAARAVMVLLLGSVPFLLMARQARYYALGMALTLLWLAAHGGLQRRHRALELLAAVGLFFTHYLVFLGAALGLLAAHGLAGRWRRAALIGAVVCLLGVPYLLAVPPRLPASAAWELKSYFQLRFLADSNDYLLPWLSLPALVWLLRGRLPRRSAASLALPILAAASLAAAVSVNPGVRYLCGVLPLAAILLALGLEALGDRFGTRALVLGLALLAFSNLASWLPYGLLLHPAGALGWERARRLGASLGPAARLDLPLRHLLLELGTTDDSFPEVVGDWLQGHVEPGERVLLTGHQNALLFHADVPLGRVVASSWIQDERVRWLVPWSPGAPGPDLEDYAWYIPGCTELAGMPADLSRWLGAAGPAVELPVAPCPRNNPPDPRTHRFSPTPGEPPTRILRLR